MTRALAAVTRAAARKHKAAHDYTAAIIHARADGATLQAIADAAGCKRPNVLRIIRRHTEATD